jgi:hypothetical protein
LRFLAISGPNVDCSGADGLIADLDTPLGEQFLDVTEAQGEAKIQPYGVPYNFRGEPVTLERERLRARSFIKIIRAPPPCLFSCGQQLVCRAEEFIMDAIGRQPRHR